MPEGKNNAFKKWLWDKVFKVVVGLVVALLACYGIALKYNYAGDAEAKKCIEKKMDITQHDRDIDRIGKDLERIEKKQEKGFEKVEGNMVRMQELIIEEIKKNK